MKCIKKGVEVRRVEDSKAFDLVKHGWIFCPKSEYKKVPVKKVEVSEQVVEKKPKVNKKKRMGMTRDERAAKAIAARNNG